jgi:hypothetical protein
MRREGFSVRAAVINEGRRVEIHDEFQMVING